MYLIKQGDVTWTTMFGQCVKIQPSPIQCLSELERTRLRQVAFYHLQDRNLDCRIIIPKVSSKRRKSLRRRLERKDKECSPKAFGIPLSKVIANDRAHKQKQDAVKESRRDCLDLEASILHFRAQKENRPPSTSNTPVGSSLQFPSEPLSPTFLDNLHRAHRRGGMSVDSIVDLDDNPSRLLEALQLSHPNELESKRVTERNSKLSLNPIYRQVPRIVDRCCHHIEMYGLQTVGIFRVGSSVKRVRQLHEDFDQGIDVILDEEHSVHDVAALLKEFFRDMPDPLLPKELYPAFLSTASMDYKDQISVLQLLIFLLPPCNCDTLNCLLQLLDKVASYAQDSIGPDREELPGNKMTAFNLATIFGPNLLQKDLNPQSYGVEDSAAIIAVVLRLLEDHETLFTVSPELQNEVLMSLVQTDPDVIDHLLRRKSCKHWDSNQTPETRSLEGQQNTFKSSFDSCTLSSGDLSPSEESSTSLKQGSLLFGHLRCSQGDDGDMPSYQKASSSEMSCPRSFCHRQESRSCEDLSLKNSSFILKSEEVSTAFKNVPIKTLEKTTHPPQFKNLHFEPQGHKAPDTADSTMIDCDKLPAGRSQELITITDSVAERRVQSNGKDTSSCRSSSLLPVHEASCGTATDIDNIQWDEPSRNGEPIQWVRTNPTSTEQTGSTHIDFGDFFDGESSGFYKETVV
ncbi:rho GTPase-activating protein 36 isoform X2 [Latimeria chalumnae]|uniref:rho GTPase-activating protein 36 isoform X2 n=1 Tax=Latimeria chalumnae TaxID=7897 RepID=UPI0006D8F75B|nr:PREDICTED: rho GTPase-activating protein 6-like isoform X2 [Latimeria chalumnae]|eukprot:XP_014346308.1 PREDICTED: rho GTPase-activating protein 6-like isoform X2 [Latimeria chalumnae]